MDKTTIIFVVILASILFIFIIALFKRLIRLLDYNAMKKAITIGVTDGFPTIITTYSMTELVEKGILKDIGMHVSDKKPNPTIITTDETAYSYVDDEILIKVGIKTKINFDIIRCTSLDKPVLVILPPNITWRD